MRTAFVVLLTLTLAAPVCAAAKDFDVVVYGGTSGGIAAAVQAARHGQDRRPHRAGQAPRRPDLRRARRDRHRQQGGHRRHLPASSISASRKHYDDDASWKYEKRRDFKGRGHEPKEDTAWTFEPHVAEQIFKDLLARTQGRRSSSANGST